MTVKEAIDRVDGIKPNTYSTEDKIRWLSFIEAIIINKIINTHEPVEEHIEDFEGFSMDDLEFRLVVPFPYDEIYVAYLQMKIDEENHETARYNNSAALYNTHYSEFSNWYNKTHMPIGERLKVFW